MEKKNVMLAQWTLKITYWTAHKYKWRRWWWHKITLQNLDKSTFRTAPWWSQLVFWLVFPNQFASKTLKFGDACTKNYVKNYVWWSFIRSSKPSVFIVDITYKFQQNGPKFETMTSRSCPWDVCLIPTEPPGTLFICHHMCYLILPTVTRFNHPFKVPIRRLTF